MEVMALAGRGWTISASARHTGLNRRTVRAYVHEGRRPVSGERPGLTPSPASRGTLGSGSAIIPTLGDRAPRRGARARLRTQLPALHS